MFAWLTGAAKMQPSMAAGVLAGSLIVFLLLWITFLVLAVGDFQANKSITQIGGYLGILTAIAAWYASARTIINEAWGREVLPG